MISLFFPINIYIQIKAFREINTFFDLCIVHSNTVSTERSV